MSTQLIAQNPVITAQSSLSEDWRRPYQRPSELIGRAVEFIQEERPPLQKNCAYVLTFFAAVALCLTLIGIPVLVSAFAEYNRQKLQFSVDDLAMCTRLLSQLSSRNITIESSLIQAIGGQNVINDIPVLNLNGRCGNTDYIDFLRPEDLSHSVMKGTDNLRDFYSFKVRNKSDGEIFVVTLFQRYANTPGNWVKGCNYASTRELFPETTIHSREIVNLYKLFQQRGSFELV